jgi:hypothetical protein
MFQIYTLTLFSPTFHSLFFVQIFQIVDNFQCREILNSSTSIMEAFWMHTFYPIRRILPDDRGEGESTENQQDQAQKICVVASKVK